MWITWLVIGIIVLLIVIAIVASFIYDKNDKKNNNYSSQDYYRSQITPSYSGNDKEEIEWVGEQGELIVSRELHNIVKDYGGYLLDNYIVKDKDGNSVEIDHILIVRCGIFVIETKSNIGTIYGSRNKNKWECIKKIYQDDKTFYNPIKQNKGHIYHLKNMLGKNAPWMESMIIFPLADISNIDDELVFSMDEAIEYLEKRMNGVTYNEQKMKGIYLRFQFLLEKYGITKEEHIQNVQNRHSGN